MEKKLVEQLKNIEVKTDAVWKKSTRDFLLSHIQSEQAIENRSAQLSLAEKLSFVKFAWRPVGAFALAGILLVGMFGITTAEAQRAMPGDTMFIVKKMLEKTQDIFTADNARKVELASVFLGNRVNELQKAIMEETQLVAADKKTDKVVLAVAEVNKQLNEVDNKIEKLKEDKKDSSAVAALMLSEKIQNYKQELKEVKNKVKDRSVDSKIDQVLAQVGEVDNHILEVIVDKQQSGQLEIKNEDLQDKLSQHVQEIEKKVTAVEQVLADKDNQKVDVLKEKAKEAKHKIEDAKKAIAKHEFKLVLTLAKDSNAILKMLYGDVYEVVQVDQNNQEGQDYNSQSAGTVKGVKTSNNQQIEQIKEVEGSKHEAPENKIIDNKATDNESLKLDRQDKEISPEETINKTDENNSRQTKTESQSADNFNVGLK